MNFTEWFWKVYLLVAIMGCCLVLSVLPGCDVPAEADTFDYVTAVEQVIENAEEHGFNVTGLAFADPETVPEHISGELLRGTDDHPVIYIVAEVTSVSCVRSPYGPAYVRAYLVVPVVEPGVIGTNAMLSEVTHLPCGQSA